VGLFLFASAKSESRRWCLCGDLTGNRTGKIQKRLGAPNCSALIQGKEFIDMPNWCKNRLSITGTKNELDKLTDFIKSDEEEGLLFDFNKIIPEPSWNWKTFSDGVGKYCDEKKEFEINGKKKILDWYWWRVLFWGTKWNLGKDYLQIDRFDNQVVMRFGTAWSPPEPIVKKLSEMFPALTFKLEYEESGYAYYGFFDCENGEVVRDDSYNITKESHPHYFEFEEDDEDDNNALTTMND
jgi:hypothetical protein